MYDDISLLSQENLKDVMMLILNRYEIFCTDTELVGEVNEVSLWLADLYLQGYTYTFFLNQPLVKLVETVFSSKQISNFVFTLSEYIALWSSVKELSIDSLTNTVYHGVLFSKGHNENSIIPPIIRSQISLVPDDIESILKGNFWLVPIYMLLISFSGTSTYDKLKSEIIK